VVGCVTFVMREFQDKGTCYVARKKPYMERRISSSGDKERGIKSTVMASIKLISRGSTYEIVNKS